jgi:hypothetical protein
MHQMAPLWAIGPGQGMEAVNRRMSHARMDWGPQSCQRSKVVGTKDPVRPLTGTDQESDGALTKFLEPPTGLAPVPHSLMLPAHKILARLHQDPHSQALVMLIDWVHPWRRPEIDKEAMTSIVTSTDDEALEALEELRNQRTF